jgi:hypothetical protein
MTMRMLDRMKTTIKVEVETRDLVRAASVQRRASFDETIRLALRALGREARREQMRRESATAMQDPDDLAESQRVLAEMESWGAR